MDYIKYKLIEGYENYIIFTTGKVFSKKRNIFMKPYVDTHGYYYVGLSNNNKNKFFKIHRILALAFIPNPNNLPTIDHIDINKQNNNLKNLRWASQTKQNINRNLQKKNTTGYIGVRYDTSKNRYEAIWRENKIQHSKSFSILKYGEDEALRLAIEYRKKMENKHYKNII
jgi:predicted phosphoadenosine phosphosulfate sulfurtransferase